MRYKEISRENSKLDMHEISRMATNDWKNLASAQKDKFVKEAAEEHASRELTAD